MQEMVGLSRRGKGKTGWMSNGTFGEFGVGEGATFHCSIAFTRIGNKLTQATPRIVDTLEPSYEVHVLSNEN